MKIIIEELKRYNMPGADIKVISNKEGVIVCEITNGEISYYLKYFINNEFKREIYYYELLKELKIKTVDVIGHTDKSLLLENINKSDKYRLAIKDDLNNKKVVIAIAKWYRELHQKGADFFGKNLDMKFYSEIELLSNDNISLIIEKSGYNNKYYWSLLKNVLSDINRFYKINKTITYNDFYHGNLIVAKDLSEAFMFDYNLLGEGLKYFDVYNVIWGLDDDMKEVFTAHYSLINEYEKQINEILSPIIGLVIAYKRDVFPNWACEDRAKLISGKLLDELNTLLESGLLIK